MYVILKGHVHARVCVCVRVCVRAFPSKVGVKSLYLPDRVSMKMLPIHTMSQRACTVHMRGTIREEYKRGKHQQSKQFLNFNFTL